MKRTLIVLIALVTLTLAACAPRTTTKPLPPEDGAAYAAEVDEYVESYLIGNLVECDSAMGRRGFDPEVWEGHLDDEITFQQNCEADRAELGAYQSKTLDHVEDRGGWRVVIYHVKFENDPDVPLVMYFNIDDPEHLIIGVEFNVR